MSIAQLIVTIASLVAGTVCFALYVYGTIAIIRARAIALRPGPVNPSDAGSGIQPRVVSVDEIGRLADAISRLTDSLSRASPSLTSLIGSLVFFAVAAVSSGALRS
jgi:hypothetical protein